MSMFRVYSNTNPQEPEQTVSRPAPWLQDRLVTTSISRLAFLGKSKSIKMLLVLADVTP